MLYLDIQPSAVAEIEATEDAANTLTSLSAASQGSTSTSGGMLAGEELDLGKVLSRDITGMIVEDEVDQYLWKQSGKILREKNEQL